MALDNSGSCINDIPDFLAELKGILSSFNRVSLRLIVFDTRVQSDEVLTEQDLYRLNKMEITGGGGTDFRPVFEACTEQSPKALIVLTDGCAQAPETPPAYPTLWVLPSDSRSPTNWGDVIHLNDNAA